MNTHSIDLVLDDDSYSSKLIEVLQVLLPRKEEKNDNSNTRKKGNPRVEAKYLS